MNPNQVLLEASSLDLFPMSIRNLSSSAVKLDGVTIVLKIIVPAVADEFEIGYTSVTTDPVVAPVAIVTPVVLNVFDEVPAVVAVNLPAVSNELEMSVVGLRSDTNVADGV